jgi:hypothetical protein
MKHFLIYASSFLLGALAVAGMMFVRASIIHAEETARHEQTMASGITMFMGMLLAPLGGLLAMAIVAIVRSVWIRSPVKLTSSDQ